MSSGRQIWQLNVTKTFNSTTHTTIRKKVRIHSEIKCPEVRSALERKRLQESLAHVRQLNKELYIRNESGRRLNGDGGIFGVSGDNEVTDTAKLTH